MLAERSVTSGPQAMATPEQVRGMMNQFQTIQLEINQLKQENQILMKIQAMGAD